MLVTELGRVMEVSAEQSKSARSQMLVAAVGIVVDWHAATRGWVAV